MRKLGKFLFLIFIAHAVQGVETKPVAVLRVIDGDTIEVAADLGGQQVPIQVRLLYVDAPEAKDNAHGKGMDEAKAAKQVLEEATKGRSVIPSSPAEKFELDRYGRTLAIVRDPLRDSTTGDSLQGLLIGGGHSVYWRKYGEAQESWAELFRKLQVQAEDEGAGIWGTNPQWMKDKANERTAPRKENE
jgi:endonuclease YncB( thermonuclease family)